MKLRPLFFIALVALIGGIAACSGGNDSSSGGVGGSGYYAQGTITGFGSIFVNGVKYETDTATIEINEQSAIEGDLKLGMIVTVGADLNKDGLSGTADSVVVDYILRGPVAVATAPDSDNIVRQVEIFGFTVSLNRNDTVFEGTSFDTVAPGDMVEVSGFLTAASGIQATRLQRTGAVNPGVSEVELSGTVSNYTTDVSFTLGPITVMLDENTEISGAPLADGQSVEVEGVVLAGLITVRATEVEPEDDSLPDDAEDVEIEGIVTEFSSIASFKVSSITVNAANAEFEPATLVNTLNIDNRVEVEGNIQNDVLIAEKVKGRSGSVRLEAFVQSVSGGQVILELATGQFVTIDTNASTIFKDDRDEVSNFGLGNLMIGDYVMIRADQINSIVATEIKRKGVEDKVKITAVVESADQMSGTVSVLGVVFNTDGNTKFERDGDSDSGSVDLTIMASEFFSDAGVAAQTAVITVSDKIDDDEMGPPETLGDGIADEVEIND